jgi:hypothetical protein
MSIEYTCKITNPYVLGYGNSQDQFIDVIYSSRGKGDICRSVRLPSSREQFEAIIEASAPILDWEEEPIIAARAAANPSPSPVEDNRLPVTII